MHIEVAARAAGITDVTFRRWMAAGRDQIVRDEDTGEERIIPAPEPYRSFRAAIEDAEAKLELDLVDQYRTVSRQAAFGNAAHLAGFLSRRFKSRWDVKQSLEVSGPEGKAIEVKGGADAERLAGILGALERAGVVALPGDAPGGDPSPDAEAD